MNLKHCPFCGGTPDLDAFQDYRAVKTGEPGTAVAIYCTVCNAEMTLCREDLPECDEPDDWDDDL